MARTHGHFLLVLAALVPSTFSLNCSIPPLYSDIHKRAVHGGSKLFQWGSFIGVGTPAQNQSIHPSLRHNVTSFAAFDFCSNSNLTDCVDSTGGSVQYNDSSTWHQSNYTSADQQSLADDVLTGTDMLHIYTHYFESDPAIGTTVKDAPVQFGSKGDVSPGIVGLGPSSTIMQRLVDLGLAAARTHGLYVGTAMDRAGGVINGSNTWGGYDAGRFKAPVHTYNMDLANADALPVTVSNILLDDPANPTVRNISLMDNDKPFEARITTDQYPLSLPYAITQNFMSALSAIPSNNSDNSLSLTKPFNGTMTIVLSDNFTITLPTETMYNASGLTPIQAQDNANTTGPFYLSTAYLSQVYLILDYDASPAKFHLAQAILENAYVMPTPLCPGGAPVPHDYDKKMSSFVANGMIGAVLGGLLGGLAIATAVVYLIVGFRNKRRNQALERRWAAEGKALGKRRTDESMDMEMSPLQEKNYGPALLPPKPYGATGYSAAPTYAPVPLPSPYASSPEADVHPEHLERSASPVSSMSDDEEGEQERVSVRAPSSLSRLSR